jgi:hypothetical protein
MNMMRFAVAKTYGFEFGKDSVIRTTSKNSSVAWNCEENVVIRDCEQYCDLKLVLVENVTKHSIRTCDNVVTYNPRDKEFIEMSVILTFVRHFRHRMLTVSVDLAQ